MEDSGSKGIVNVCGGGRNALNDPQFLIEHGGKLYLTLAVLEYDPNHPELDEQQKNDIAELDKMLGDVRLRGFVTPHETRARIFAATNPPRLIDY